MNIRLNFLLIIILVVHYGNTQDFGLRKTTELLQEYTMDSLNAGRYTLGYIGQNHSKLYFNYENLQDRSEKIFLLENHKLTDRSSEFDFVLEDYIPGSASYISNRFLEGDFVFYERDYFESPDDYGYTKLFLYFLGKNHFLDSIYNADKLIHSSFSEDGRYLLVNTLNTLSDYYNPDQDNRIMVYDLENIDQGRIKKQYIPCMHCSDSYLVEDQLFFTVGRRDGYEGFSIKDIYVSPWGSLKDSVKIADNTDIKDISPDGKYILGTRFWDRQKTTAVIVDVSQKKYQMLLGRDYGDRIAFFSHHENKFAFDYEGFIIYVVFPTDYPFDALNWRNEEIPLWTEQEFWKQFEHTPLPNNE